MQMAVWMSLNEESMTYQPTVFFNDFWLLRNYLVPVNESLAEQPIQLNLNSMGYMKFMMYLQMEQSFSMQVRRTPCAALLSHYDTPAGCTTAASTTARAQNDCVPLPHDLTQQAEPTARPPQKPPSL